MKPLNLASRPFRNEKLPQVVLSLASVLVLALSLFQARAIVRLLPRNTSQLAQEVNSLDEEGRRLRSDASRLRNTKPNPADAARWSNLKDLVDRRVFSWTRLFAVLEEALPMGVRLVSISPKTQKGELELQLQTMARSVEDGFEMIRALEERPEFENVLPESRGAQTPEGFPFQYSMKYKPGAAPPPKASPSPSPEATPGEAAGTGEQP